VANLQVKGLPEDLHEELRRRADADGTTLSELVTRMIRRELALPSLSDWLTELASRPARETDLDVESLMDEIRD
jgi:plasmid stability protein